MSRQKDMYKGLLHNNGQLLCAVDVETTGTDPDIHDLVQVAVLPLDHNIEPIKSITPFNLALKPRNPGSINYNALKINRMSYLELMQCALDPDHAADMFTDWVARLNLPLGKKIMPLWSNGNFDRGFLMAWLGPQYYSDCFYFLERDTQHTALFINDVMAHRCEPLPFNRVGLNSLAGALGIVNDMPHDALFDCVTTAAVYRALLELI